MLLKFFPGRRAKGLTEEGFCVSKCGAGQSGKVCIVKLSHFRGSLQALFVHSSCTVRAQSGPKLRGWGREESGKCFAIREEVGGREGIRTPDPLLAKQAQIQSKSLLRLRLAVS